MLSPETEEEIRSALARYPRPRSAVLDALRAVQRQLGFCHPEALAEAAEILGIDANALQMLVTFYDMLYEAPVGEHILMPCKNIACYLRGSDRIIEHISNRLGIRPGETSSDGKFTLQPMECLAACDLAPMMIADETYYGPLTEERVDEILDQLRRIDNRPPGPAGTRPHPNPYLTPPLAPPAGENPLPLGEGTISPPPRTGGGAGGEGT
jgi:NADH-quinone oxidoreductase subunit E